MGAILFRKPTLWAMVATATLLIGVPVRPASADYIGSELGAAGNWAVLDIGSTGSVTMTGGSVIGNVGIAGGSLNFTGATINGSADVGTGVTVTHTGGSVTGGINTGVNFSSAAGAARSASTTFAGLAATQSISGNQINGTTTISAAHPGGLNVIDLSGITLTGQVLTLNGPAGSEFVFNDSGGMTLTSGQIVLTGGLTANDVVLNDTGTGGVTMTGGVLNGTILAPNASVTLTSGLVDGEIIGGNSVTLTSGQVVDAPHGAPGPIIGAGLPAFAFLGGGFLLARRLRRRVERGQLTAPASP
jgi:choice-of-anchor A domain-containing protein